MVFRIGCAIVLFFVLSLIVGYVADIEKRVVELERKAEMSEMGAMIKTPATEQEKQIDGIPASVSARIRAQAESTFPNDFSMQKFSVDRDTEAWKQLHPAK